MSSYVFRDVTRFDGPIGPAGPSGPERPERPEGPGEFVVDLERVAGVPLVTPRARPGSVALTIDYNDGRQSDTLAGGEAEANRFLAALTAFRAGAA
jgi:hypothetical protein